MNISPNFLYLKSINECVVNEVHVCVLSCVRLFGPPVDCGPSSKFLLNCYNIASFLCWFFGLKACGILVIDQGSNP